MTREELIDKMLKARTREQIREAQADSERWLKDYPQDTPVILAGEQLAMKATSFTRS